MPTENNQLAVRAPNAALSLMPTTPEAAFKFAEFLAGASLMPNHLRGKPADCFLILMRAVEWQMNPLAVAEKTSVINGKLMFEGQLVAALVNTRTNLEEPLDYQFEGEGDNRVLHVIGKVAGWKTPREIVLTHRQAKAINKNGQMNINPEQQMCYIGSRLWARRYTPEVLLGVYAPDEMGETDTTTEPDKEPTAEELAARAAKVPKKEKGVRAMKTVTEASEPTTSAPAEQPSAPVQVIPATDPVIPAGASGVLQEPEKPKEKPPVVPVVPQAEGWPKVLEGIITAVRGPDIVTKDGAKDQLKVQVPGVDGGDPTTHVTRLLTIDSPEAIAAGLGVLPDNAPAGTKPTVRLVVSPFLLEKLLPKAVASAAVVKLTVEKWPSLTKPGTTYGLVTDISEPMEVM